MGSSNRDYSERINVICIDVGKMLSHYEDAVPTKTSPGTKHFTQRRKCRPCSTNVTSSYAFPAGITTKAIDADSASAKGGCCFWSMGARNPLPPLSPADPLILDDILRCDNDEDKKYPISTSSYGAENYRVSCSFPKPKSEFVIKAPSPLGKKRKKHLHFTPHTSSRYKSSRLGRCIGGEFHSEDVPSYNRTPLNTNFIGLSEEKNAGKVGSPRAGLHSPSDVPNPATQQLPPSTLGGPKSLGKIFLEAASHQAVAEVGTGITPTNSFGLTLTRGSAHRDTAEEQDSVEHPVMTMHEGVSRLATHLVTSYHPSPLAAGAHHWGLPVSAARQAYPNSKHLGLGRLLDNKNLITKGMANSDTIIRAPNLKKKSPARTL
ncbi:unnamed protein product [Phytomonas sp. Hart1]|nr:unnamed protein product [Phytomonas sp. Hart1]|eukprot:CCW66975.1 unnamed protein product [Phytomonas sp. isolate Hart1]